MAFCMAPFCPEGALVTGVVVSAPWRGECVCLCESQESRIRSYLAGSKHLLISSYFHPIWDDDNIDIFLGWVETSNYRYIYIWLIRHQMSPKKIRRAESQIHRRRHHPDWMDILHSHWGCCTSLLSPFLPVFLHGSHNFSIALRLGGMRADVPVVPSFELYQRTNSVLKIWHVKMHLKGSQFRFVGGKLVIIIQDNPSMTEPHVFVS